MSECRLGGRGQSIALKLREATPDSERTAYWSGLKTCGSVWACPMCSPLIRHNRGMYVEATVAQALEQGLGVVFVSLTLQHYGEMTLRRTLEGLVGAWGRLNTGRFWRNLHVVGYWRATEITFGFRNGWHPHLHLLVFGEKEDLARLVQGDELSRAWRACLNRAGLTCTLERGARADWVSDQVGGVYSRYLAKVKNEEGDWHGVATEMVSLWKQGRRDNLTTFELLAGATTGEEVLVRAWHEYEQVTKGRHAIDASEGLRKRFEFEPEPEEELGEEMELPTDETLMLIPAQDYRRLFLAGFACDVLEAAERDPKEARKLVRGIVRRELERERDG